MTTVTTITMSVLLVAVGTMGTQRLVGEPDSLEFSCGIFRQDVAEVDLIGRFGRANVSQGPVFGFDDGPQDGTILFAEQPDARVEIIWHDPLARREPAMITVREHARRWRTRTGITVGTDLRSLERTNARPFRLAGLRIEGGGGGAVISWAGGRLEPSQSDRCRLGVYFQPADDGTAPDSIRQVVSGREYSSGHPAFQALNPRVVALVIAFPRTNRAG